MMISWELAMHYHDVMGNDPWWVRRDRRDSDRHSPGRCFGAGVNPDTIICNTRRERHLSIHMSLVHVEYWTCTVQWYINDDIVMKYLMCYSAMFDDTMLMTMSYLCLWLYVWSRPLYDECYWGFCVHELRNELIPRVHIDYYVACQVNFIVNLHCRSEFKLYFDTIRNNDHDLFTSKV